MTPVFPTLDSNGLPTWIRADLRAMPTDYAGRNDLRSRRPMVMKVPVRPAGRVGAAGCPSAGSPSGRTLAALVVVVLALVVWWRT